MMSAELTDVQERMMAELVNINKTIMERDREQERRTVALEKRIMAMEQNVSQKFEEIDAALKATTGAVQAWDTLVNNTKFLKGFLAIAAAATAILAGLKGIFFHR